MYTQCPECQTVYSLDQAQLGAASGQVRCGACMTVFNAQAQQLDSLPIPLVTQEQRGGNDLLARAVPAARSGILTRASWSILSIGLFLSLVLQGGYLFREQLAVSETFGPLMETLCENLHCTLPLPHDPEQIELVDYTVTAHPEHADAWRITAALLNTANFDQHYPVLRVSLPREDGSLMAARDFTAAEYLAEGKDPDDNLYPQEPVGIQLDISNPGQQTAALHIDIY